MPRRKKKKKISKYERMSKIIAILTILMMVGSLIIGLYFGLQAMDIL